MSSHLFASLALADFLGKNRQMLKAPLDISALKTQAARYSYLFVGNLLGLMFLGNLVTKKLTEIAPSILELIPELLVRPLVGYSKQSPSIFEAWDGCNVFNFCSQPADVGGKFGLPMLLLVIIAAIALFPGSKVANAEKPRISIPLFFLFSWFFLVTVFIFDFMNGNAQGWISMWVKTRLIEPWFYAMVIAAITLINGRSHYLRVAVFVWLAISIVGVQIQNNYPLPRQIMANARYLKSIL